MLGDKEVAPTSWETRAESKRPEQNCRRWAGGGTETGESGWQDMGAAGVFVSEGDIGGEKTTR